MKKLVLAIMALSTCLLGCAAAHYHERDSERVTLFLRAPGAEKVEFASSLDAYERHRADKLRQSLWAVSVAADSEFRYFYIVDGRVVTPECELYEKDDFGSRNCVYVP